MQLMRLRFEVKHSKVQAAIARIIDDSLKPFRNSVAKTASISFYIFDLRSVNGRIACSTSYFPLIFIFGHVTHNFSLSFLIKFCCHFVSNKICFAKL